MERGRGKEDRQDKRTDWKGGDGGGAGGVKVIQRMERGECKLQWNRIRSERHRAKLEGEKIGKQGGVRKVKEGKTRTYHRYSEKKTRKK